MTTDKGIYIKNIYYMLSYAFQALQQKSYDRIAGEDFENVFDLFAEILRLAVSSQLKQGLYREYTDVSEILPTVRGKINISDTIKQHIKKHNKVTCEYDIVSDNNLYNRIVLTTIEKLIHIKDVDKNRRKALIKLLPFFCNVDSISPEKIEWNKLIYQRSNKNYELIINICRFVLGSRLLTTENGKHLTASFSDNHMEQLYERFILSYYKKHHPELSPKAKKVEWNFTSVPDMSIEYLPDMKTDITLTKNGKALIIDAKYYKHTMVEHFSKKTLRSAHLYQIYTYVKNYDTNNTGNTSGLLLYAKTDESLTPDFQYEIGHNSIAAKTLDLNSDFKVISSCLERIVSSYFT